MDERIKPIIGTVATGAVFAQAMVLGFVVPFLWPIAMVGGVAAGVAGAFADRNTYRRGMLYGTAGLPVLTFGAFLVSEAKHAIRQRPPPKTQFNGESDPVLLAARNL